MPHLEKVKNTIKAGSVLIVHYAEVTDERIKLDPDPCNQKAEPLEEGLSEFKAMSW